MKCAILLLLATSLPSSSLAQALSPEQIGRQMFQAAGPTRPFENMQNLTPEHHAAAMIEWSRAFEAPVGKSPGAVNLMLLIPKTGELYENGEFQPAKSSEMAGHLKSVSKEMLKS